MYRVYILLFMFFGCSSTLPDESLSLAEHLKIGLDYLDEEKYVKAQDEFKFVLSRGTGTDYGDDAQFFLAESYFLNNQFILSIKEYENLLDDFPESEHGQNVTESMSILRNKLAKKLYETGVLYLKMDEFEPARMSFNSVLDQYYDTDIVEEVHVGVIKSYIKNNKIKQAKEYWLNKGQEDIVSEELINEVEHLFAEVE